MTKKATKEVRYSLLCVINYHRFCLAGQTVHEYFTNAWIALSFVKIVVHSWMVFSVNYQRYL